MEKELDVIEILTAKKKRLLAEVAKIDRALSVLKEEPLTEQDMPRRKISWKNEIVEIFKETDRGLSSNIVIELLARKDIPEAKEKRGRNNVLATLSKLKKSGFLERDSGGIFHYKKEGALF